jgi:hypothetical protein
MWEKYTSTGCMPEKITPTMLKDNLSMKEEIQEVQEDPSDH